MRQGQGSFAAVAKVATRRLRRSDKSDREKVTRVAKVTRLLCSSGKSDNRAAAVARVTKRK